MATTAKALSSNEVKQQLRAQGKTLKQFALEQGVEPNDVYRVIGGSRKALYGKGHQIAVALGMKLNPDHPDKD